MQTKKTFNVYTGTAQNQYHNFQCLHTHTKFPLTVPPESASPKHVLHGVDIHTVMYTFAQQVSKNCRCLSVVCQTKF